VSDFTSVGSKESKINSTLREQEMNVKQNPGDRKDSSDTVIARATMFPTYCHHFDKKSAKRRQA
jgi:hypothetical protein